MKYNWKVLSREKVYDGSPHLNIFSDQVQLPNGKIINDYHRIEAKDAVILLVENEKKELLVYNEYRHGVGKRSYTLPAGGIDNKEDIFKTSSRELFEETGYTAHKESLLGKYLVSSSYRISEVSFIYLTDIRQVSKPTCKDIENPDFLWLDKKSVMKAIKTKKFVSVVHLSAVMSWLFKEIFL